MTATRKEAMVMLERMPEDKLSFVIQILQGVNGLLGASSIMTERKIDLDQFVMSETDRGRNADAYIRELRDNDKF